MSVLDIIKKWWSKQSSTNKKIISVIAVVLLLLCLWLVPESAPAEDLTGGADADLSASQDISSAEGDLLTEDEPQQNDEQEKLQDTPDTAPVIDENGSYTTAEDVALYIYTYGRLPDNFITKNQAGDLGWEGGSLEPYAPGCCIGGDRFGNYEGLLPDAEGRTWTECDINTLGAEKRGAERIVFSNDGLIYYTSDHYENFTLLYGGESQ